MGSGLGGDAEEAQKGGMGAIEVGLDVDGGE